MPRPARLIKCTITWTAAQKAWLAEQAIRSGLASEAAVARQLVQAAMDAARATELAQAS